MHPHLQVRAAFTHAALKAASRRALDDEEEERPRGRSMLPLAGLLAVGGLGAKGLSNAFGNDAHYENIRQALQQHGAPYRPWETAATRYQGLMARGAGSSLFGAVPVGDIIANLRKEQKWGDVFSHPRLKALFANATTGPADLLSIPADYRSKSEGSHLQDLAHYEQFSKGPVAAWWHQLQANGKSVPVSPEAAAAAPGATTYENLLGDRFKQYFRQQTNTDWLEPHEITQKRVPFERQEEIMKGFYESLPPELQQERHRVETGLWGDKYKAHTENYGKYMRSAVGMHDKMKRISRTALGGAGGAGVSHLLHDLVRGEDEEGNEQRDWKYWLSMLGGAGVGGAVGHQWPALARQFQ
jgi:hypothetical protein